MTRVEILRTSLLICLAALAQTVAAPAEADEPTPAAPAVVACTGTPDSCAVDLDACDVEDQGDVDPAGIDQPDDRDNDEPNSGDGQCTSQPTKKKAHSASRRMSALLAGVAPHLVRVHTRMGIGSLYT